MRTIKLSSFGEDKSKEFTIAHDWSEDGKDISVQGGGSGVVFSKTGGRRTAFFEAFPNKPSCFVRGEGVTIGEAEENAWQRYQRIINCPGHDMDRRNRKDGYAYCKHCTYSGMVYEPLTKCCKCGVPTNYANDFRGRIYCKKHSRAMPKSKDPKHWSNTFAFTSDKRLPRKLKKKYKEAFLFDLYYKNQIKAKDARLKKGSFRIKSSGYTISQFNTRSIKKYIRAVLSTKKKFLNHVRKNYKTG